MTGKLVHPTVLAIHLRDDGVMGGCEQYRVRIPFEMVREHINTAMDWVPVGKARDWAGGKLDMRTRPTDYDVIVLPRHRPLPYGHEGTPRFQDLPPALVNSATQLGMPLQGRAHLLDLIRLLKQKQVVVLEYDDDHWTGSRDLGNYRYLDLQQAFMQEADAITVTTPYMRRIANEAAPGVPVYILPNCVNFGEWQGWERWKRWPEDYIVLGLTGSVTHYRDWQVLEDVLPQIMREHGNVALLLQGFVPDYLQSLVGQYPDRAYADEAFRHYTDYPGVVRQADIVLCPVMPDDPFNWGKSQIKAVEGYAAGRPLSYGGIGGAAAIASNLDYYREALGNGHRGIIADHTPDAWYAAIKALVDDKERRERYGRLGWAWVKKNRAIERQWRLWWDAYKLIYRRKQ